MSFWIEKISASGDKKKPSTIYLKEGTNIICGPSNTGKTCIAKCIEYMFGETKKSRFCQQLDTIVFKWLFIRQTKLIP